MMVLQLPKISNLKILLRTWVLRLSKEVATKTNDVAGDGTTTATVLAQAMINEGMKNLAAGANPIILRKGMQKATEVAVDAIKEMSSNINRQGLRLQELLLFPPVMTEVGEMVADAMEKVTNDGVITIEESKTMHTELDLVEGMQFDRGYLVRLYVQQIWTRWLLNLTTHTSSSQIRRSPTFRKSCQYLNRSFRAVRSYLIIAEDVEGEALTTLST